MRCLAVVDSGRARLQSRQQRRLTRYFPEIVTALCEHFSKVVLDGELVVAGPGGRLDFMALTRRLAGDGSSGLPGRASYVVFDALSAGGTDLRGYPYRVRRAVLEQLLDGARSPLAIVPMTTDGAAAQVWLSDHLRHRRGRPPAR
jgi:ATP-dependent DNA ligase